MAQINHQETGRVNVYRLQTSAYVNHGETSSLCQSRSDSGNGRLHFQFLHHADVMSHGNSSFGIKPRRSSMFNLQTEQKSKSLLHLPVVITDDMDDNTSRRSVSADELPSNAQKQLATNQLSQANISTSVVLIPTHTSRSKTAKLITNPTAGPLIYKNKRRRLSLEDDPNRLAMKMSLPCRGGCCYCVYTSLLGPVKVYFTRADKPKKEPLLLRIKDGNGKPVIPVSRKSDIRGLVYDPISCSLHPPVRGQRPMFQEHRQFKKVK